MLSPLIGIVEGEEAADVDKSLEKAAEGEGAKSNQPYMRRHDGWIATGSTLTGQVVGNA